MGTILRTFPLAFLILANSATAYAEPFTILPNGDLVFNVSANTSGLFTCGSAVPCTGSGTNSITLQSGSGAATFSFTGVSTSFSAGNTTIPVTVGTFEDSATPGFALPGGIGQFATLFAFDFTISHTSPVAASRSLDWNFDQTFTRFGEGGRTYLEFPIGEQPPQYHYTGIIYTFRVFPLTLPLNGSKDLVADVGAVPEPASMALVATGLVGAWWRRRRNLRSEQ